MRVSKYECVLMYVFPKRYLCILVIFIENYIDDKQYFSYM